MANVDFYTTNAAANNTEAARLRESTRMACIAYGLKRLGHDVRLVSVSDSFVQSGRWLFFSEMFGEPRHGAVTVRPAEELIGSSHRCDVAIKCSVKTTHDASAIRKCKVLVAHEYDKSVASHKGLLPVPFLVHDRVIEWLCSSGMFWYYLDDDVETFRDCFPSKDTAADTIAFAGMGYYGRKDVLHKMEAAFPGQCDFIVKETPEMDGSQYMNWLASHKYALVPHGDTPKTNRWAEAALLGLAIISPEQRTKVVPPQSIKNTIMPVDWDDVVNITFGATFTEQIVANATADYLAGWSPTGQARLICQWLGLETVEPEGNASE